MGSDSIDLPKDKKLLVQQAAFITYTEVITTEPVILYRVYGGNASQLGAYCIIGVSVKLNRYNKQS